MREHAFLVAMEMMNGLGRVSSGTGVVCRGEEKCEGVLEGSRRNVKESMQDSLDLPQSWTQAPRGKSHSHPHWPPYHFCSDHCFQTEFGIPRVSDIKRFSLFKEQNESKIVMLL